MTNINTDVEKCHFTSRATLIALGVRVKQMKIMDTIGQYVSIKQKTVTDSPLEKLTDALITIFAGGQGLVETNKLVGSDPAVQRAFGRERCGSLPRRLLPPGRTTAPTSCRTTRDATATSTTSGATAARRVARLRWSGRATRRSSSRPPIRSIQSSSPVSSIRFRSGRTSTS